MPFAVPSHMGLSAPLWRWWPRHFDPAAVCLGSVMPDVVDGAIGLSRGHLGQGLGHSFVGLPLLCVPFGWLIWLGVLRAAARAKLPEGNGFWARCWAESIVSVRNGARASRAIVTGSIAAGTVSHLVTDVISHGEAPWLQPWIKRLPLFPHWWEHEWFRMPIPGYGGGTGYPFAPHFIAWMILTVVGAWWLLAPVYKSAK